MTKNYVILTSDNTWASTLTNVEPDTLKDEIDYIRVEMDIEEDTKVFAYEYVGEAIEF